MMHARNRGDAQTSHDDVAAHSEAHNASSADGGAKKRPLATADVPGEHTPERPPQKRRHAAQPPAQSSSTSASSSSASSSSAASSSAASPQAESDDGSSASSIDERSRPSTNASSRSRSRSEGDAKPATAMGGQYFIVAQIVLKCTSEGIAAASGAPSNVPAYVSAFLGPVASSSSSSSSTQAERERLQRRLAAGCGVTGVSSFVATNGNTFWTCRTSVAWCLDPCDDAATTRHPGATYVLVDERAHTLQWRCKHADGERFEGDKFAATVLVTYLRQFWPPKQAAA